MNLTELKKRHQGWLDREGTSRGQREDSETILKLCEVIEVIKDALEKIVEPPEFLESGGDGYSLFANLIAHKALARAAKLLEEKE